MSDSIRTRFSSTADAHLVEKFKKLSDETRIAQSKLLDEAFKDLLDKYENK